VIVNTNHKGDTVKTKSELRTIALKAVATRNRNTKARSLRQKKAAHKAWITIRAKHDAHRKAALKAWRTIRK